MKTSRPASLDFRRLRGTGFLLIAFLSCIVNADAQLSWGVNGAGGGGTWDSATPDWFDGTNNVPWVNDGPAAFGGIGGTVTISGSVRASEVAFGVPGYLLQGGTLASAPGGLTVRADADAMINSTIAGPAGSMGVFTKTGVGSLTMGSYLYNFARVQIDSGELNLPTGSGTPLISLSESGNASLTLGSLLNSGSSSTLYVSGLSGRGTVKPGIDTFAKTLGISGIGGSFSGTIQDKGGMKIGLSMSGTGTQELTGINTYTGATTVSAGTLALAGCGSALNTTVTINGGTLLFDNTIASIADRISDSAPISLTAGAIVLKGNGAVASVEAVGALTVANNPVLVVVNPDMAQPAALNFASLGLRGLGHTGIVSFTGPSLGQTPGPGVASIRFNTPPPLVGGSDLHPEAFILPGALGISASGSTFVTYGANGIRPLDDADYASNIGSVSGWENASIGNAQTISSDTTINSLRLQSGVAISGSGRLAVRSGVILTRPGNATITVDALDFGSNEAIIINEGNLTIASRVTGSNTTTGLTKNGAGRLTLAGASSFSGLIDVFQGVLRLQNSAILNVTVRAGAAIELLGGVTTNGSSWAIIGNGPDGRGGLRSVSGDNRIGSLLLLSSSYNIDVASGSLTVAGNLSSNALVKTGVGTLTVMGPAGSSTPTVLGGGTLASTYQFGAPFGTSPVTLNGSTLRFSPVHASTGVVSINVGAISYKGGASTLAIDKGTNASLTLTVGPSGGAGAFVRTGPATLLIAPAGGLAALGVTEKIKLNSTLDTAFPTINGIVSTSIIGQDTDANHSGDFLGYTAATGLKPTTYSTSTNLNTAATTAVFNATTPQTLTRNVMVYALKNSGQTIDLAGRALSIGGQSYSREALILNGGSILGGSLVFSGTSIADVYTSLAGGTISSTVTGSGYGSGAFAKFGPGTLTLSGTTRVNILVESGGLKLDGPLPESLSSVAGSVTLARGATLSGAGRVSGTVAGGLISPGNGAGTLAANSTGSADTTNSGLNESFAPTSFAFEFTRLDAPLFGVPTASGNDLLRLTSATAPFSSVLTADDEIDIYLSIAGGVRPGDSFLGRFYTDRNASFVSSIANANYHYFLRDDLGGTHFNGTAYSERTDLPFEIDSIPQIANFGSGEVNGYIMQVRVVPEPSAMLLLLVASVALWSGLRARRAAHGGKSPRTREKDSMGLKR